MSKEKYLIFNIKKFKFKIYVILSLYILIKKTILINKKIIQIKHRNKFIVHSLYFIFFI